jgi:rubrerythrin
MEQLGSQVEERAKPTAVVASDPLPDEGFLEFLVAGTQAVGEFRCSDCGYGAVIQRLLPHCPMCGGEVWESRPPSGPRFSD